MKCIKHKLTGVITRVTDEQADKLTGPHFSEAKYSYVPKSEYKKQNGGKTVEQVVEAEKKETTSSKKVDRHLKLKLKQR